MSDDECPTLVSAKVPVTILTGFLGSGKTTLLHYILTVQHGLKIAVIVNEFEFGKSIEKGLTLKSSQKADDEWLELDNGCMCCTSQSQTVLALENLMRKKSTFDLVLVETSGMADPGPIAAMFWQDDALCGMLYLSGIVTLVDAKHIHRHLVAPDTKNEALRQILACDKIVLNKVDLVTKDELEATRALLREINPAAEIITSSYSKVDPDILRSLLFIDTTNTFDPCTTTGNGIRESSLGRAEEVEEEGKCGACAEDSEHHANHHVHSSGISAVSVEIKPSDFGESQNHHVVADSLKDIDLMCRDLLYHDGKESFEIIRAKGAMWVKKPTPDAAASLFQLQAICEVFDVLPMEGATVPYGTHRFLFLGRRLQHDRIKEIIISHLNHKL